MGLNIKILIFMICLSGALIIYYTRYNEKQQVTFNKIIKVDNMVSKNFEEKYNNLSINYVISSPSCKMLDFNPWDKSIQKYLIKPKPLVCSNLPPLTYVKEIGNFTYSLNLNKKNFKKYRSNRNHTIKCCYSLITRINQHSKHYNDSADDLFQQTECKYFEDNFFLPSFAEFIFVKCFKYQHEKKIGKEIYKNMHAVVPILPEVYKKIEVDREKYKKKSWKISTKKNKLNPLKINIIILGIDSVSKLNFKRIMPLTMKYLQKNNWVHLEGYNKIGDNTFPNLMAILNGQSMNFLNYWKNNTTKKMDECPSIWKDFGRLGYISLYAEDTPVISTFNFMRTGFVKKPTNYYMRPFMLAAHELLNQKVLNGLPVCTGPVLVLDHIFNYAKMFYKAFSDTKHFSLLWSNSLSHNDLNAPKALDDSIYKFLNDLSNLGIYNNSLIFLLSDHGVKFGNIRETFMGYVEERQPFVYIWLPEWFKEKYPEKYSNLLINQNRLTTPYDVHITFKNILQLVNDEAQENFNNSHQTKEISPGCPKCTGLFEIQPLERSCSDASIDITWCLCCEFRHLDVYDQNVLSIASFIYDYIVNQTETLVVNLKIKKGLCSKWEFLKVYRSQEVIEQEIKKPDESVTNFRLVQKNTYKKVFIIIVELNPGKTKFEAMVRVNFSKSNKSFTFLEYPKRMDGIYKTSKCVKIPNLKFYCYCKKQ